MNPGPLSAYRNALASGGGVTREDPAASASMPELEWQARWFAGEFGREWTTVDGRPIRVLDFGKWNREPGPDFVDALVTIGDREVRGDIELDPDARDWEHHGHATNPAYRDVALHVCMRQPPRRFFTRTVDHREVAQLHLSAHPPLPQPRRQESPLLGGCDPQAILLPAARHRLDVKARSLQCCAAVHGESEAWFAALAAALGYKHNQIPFLLLAQRVGQRAAAGVNGEASLFGVAGFLESPASPAADRAVRGYLRGLWEGWWSMRAGCEQWILPHAAWRTGGVRPANHPHRRVAALACIAASWSPIRRALAQGRRDALVETLESIEHPFWASRYNLQASPLARPHALIGGERIRDILINIFHPIAVALEESAWADFLRERAPTPAVTMRAAAQKFFGGIDRKLLASAAIQQGLLQLDRDHRISQEPAAFLDALRGAA